MLNKCRFSGAPSLRGRVFKASSKRWVLKVKPRQFRRSIVAPVKPTLSLVQPDLFGLPSPSPLSPRTTRIDTRRNHRVKKRVKGLQYKLQMRVRKVDRKISFHHKATKESHLGNDEVWSDKAIRCLHYVLLMDSILSLKSLGEIRSEDAAEILLWMDREGDGSFSFDTCVYVAGQLSVDPSFRNPFPNLDLDFIGLEPERLRYQLKKIIRKNFGSLPPHAGLLKRGIKAAESGDQDALQWVLSDTEDSMGFSACCTALGFEAREVRDLICVPHQDTGRLATA